MKKFETCLTQAVSKNGKVIAGCAIAFAKLSANSSCFIPYYEPKEPKGLSKLRK